MVRSRGSPMTPAALSAQPSPGAGNCDLTFARRQCQPTTLALPEWDAALAADRCNCATPDRENWIRTGSHVFSRFRCIACLYTRTLSLSLEIRGSRGSRSSRCFFFFFFFFYSSFREIEFFRERERERCWWEDVSTICASVVSQRRDFRCQRGSRYFWSRSIFGWIDFSRMLWEGWYPGRVKNVFHLFLFFGMKFGECNWFGAKLELLFDCLNY